MTNLKTLLAAALLVSAISIPSLARAGDEKKPKPYPLETCIVSGEKLDGDSGMKPYTFVHEGQEIKLCCKSCLKDFNKEPAKYLKKLAEAKKPDAKKK